MRIAVTGAAGYVGGHLCRELAARGHEVHAQDRLPPPPAPVPPWESFRVFDLAAADSRRSWLASCRPDAVVHLAALYGRVWGERDLAETCRVNAGLTADLARDVPAQGARLVLVSSSEVYGATAAAGGLVTEGAPLAPLNMYGLSKKWAEEAARAYAPDGLAVCRLNMPYGPAAADPEPGEVPATSGRVGPLGFNVLHTMCWQAAHGMPLTVHRGTWRCMTWAGDAVRGLAVILESGAAGTWNVSRNDEHAELADLARRIVSAAGSASEIRAVDLPPGVTRRKSLDNAALLRLGWRPAVDLGEGIGRCLDYYRKFDKSGAWQG